MSSSGSMTSEMKIEADVSIADVKNAVMESRDREDGSKSKQFKGDAQYGRTELCKCGDAFPHACIAKTELGYLHDEVPLGQPCCRCATGLVSWLAFFGTACSYETGVRCD